MNTELFTEVKPAHMQRSKEHCIDEVRRTKKRLIEMQEFFDSVFNRAVNTGVEAGVRSASLAQERAWHAYSQACAVYQQYLGD